MKITVLDISPLSAQPDFDFMRATVEIKHNDPQGIESSCIVNIPLPKQTITISEAEELAIQTAKRFLLNTTTSFS